MKTATIHMRFDTRELAWNLARAGLAALLCGHSMAKTAEAAREARHALKRLDRIRNVRLRVLAQQVHVAHLFALQQAALERAHGRKGGILGQPWIPTAWLRPGHWSYRVALAFVFSTLVAVAGFLGWLVFTTPWSA